MVKRNPEKCKTSGKERDDRAAISKNRFDPLSIEIKYPDTVILLLKCQENPALVAAADALSKFGSKSSENLELLFDLDIVGAIIPLLEHEDIFVRRFSTKLLAEMTVLPKVRNYLLNSECYVPHFTSVLQNDTDVFIHEFVTLILAEVSKDIYGVAQILKQCKNLDVLFEKIRSPDPDVKKNSIEIIHNFLRDPFAAQEIINTKGFSFPSIYELLKEPYPEIQLLTLDVINFFIERNRDENIQELFRTSRGPQALLDILDNDECDDLHQKVLEILSSACDNEKTAELISSTGGIQKLLKYMENRYNNKMPPDLLNVIVRLANSSNGRRELHKVDITTILLNLLHESPNPDIIEACFYGIARMSRYGPASETIASSNPIKKILDFIKNENVKQSIRHTATYCLAELLASDIKNCSNFLNTGGQSHLIRMIKQPVEKVPLETQISVLQCLIATGGYPELREQIIDTDLIDALCARLELERSFSSAESRVAYCEALATFCLEKSARDIFVHLEGPKRLHKLIQDSESVPVRDAAARFVSQLCTDQAVAPRLILAGCLEYMIEHRSASRIVPSWETCIKALLNSYLPAKFAFTGHLSLHDITKNGFFVMKRNICPFPILEQLFTLNLSPTQTIYTCNLADPRPKLNENFDGKDKSVSSSSKKNSTSNTKIRDKTFSLYDTNVTNAIMGEQHEKLQIDPFLYDMVKLFKCKLIANEPKVAYEQEIPGLVNIRYIKSRAKILGEFVARKMSGPDPTTKCIDHQLECHLNEIKQDIGTNIVPLGQLRVGSYLERALLFKVIADQICLPVALVRGNYGKAWIEIALPEIDDRNNGGDPLPDSADPNPNKSRQTSSLKPLSESARDQVSFEGPMTGSSTNYNHLHTSCIFPTKLLRPNYVVDLMEFPGELIPLYSKRAEKYCNC